MRMPGMNGLDTLRAIRKILQEAGKEALPEIVMSAYDDHQALTEAKNLGVRKFVMKPFELSDFLDLIQKQMV